MSTNLVASVSGTLKSETVPQESTVFTVGSVPRLIKDLSPEWNVNLQIEVKNMNDMLSKNNFYVDISDKLIKGLRSSLGLGSQHMTLSNSNDDHSAKTTQFGLMYYLYLAIEKLYFNSSADVGNLSKKLFGSDPFAEKLAIIRILWDIFCKWYIQNSGNDQYSTILKQVDEVMMKEQLSEEQFKIFEKIFNPELMLGFLIWFKYYFIPLLESDTDILLKTREVIEGNDQYMNIIKGDDNVLDNYGNASKALDVISGSGKSENNAKSGNNANNGKKQSGDDEEENNTKKKSNVITNENMTASILAIYYMGSVLAYIKKHNEGEEYKNLSKAVSTEYKLPNSDQTTDIARVQLLYSVISKNNDKIKFNQADINMFVKEVMEADVLSGEADATVFISILNIYFGLKNFLKGVVSSDESNSTHLGKPTDLIKGLAEKRGMLLTTESSSGSNSGSSSGEESVSTSNEDKISPVAGGGYYNNSNTQQRQFLKSQAIKKVDATAMEINFSQIIRNLIESMNFLISNKPSVKNFAQIKLTGMLQGVSGDNFIIVAVTENSAEVIPILWIEYPKTIDKSDYGILYKITKKYETADYYDLSFDPRESSTEIGKFRTNKSGYGELTFESEALSKTPVRSVDPDNVSKLKAEDLYNAQRVNKTLANILENDISFDISFLGNNQQNKNVFLSLDINTKGDNGTKESHHVAKVEDKMPVDKDPKLFNASAEGVAADITLCDNKLGQFEVLDKDKLAERFISKDSFESYPNLVNGVFVFTLNDNFLNVDRINYDVAAIVPFLHFFYLIRNYPSKFRDLKKQIKKSFINPFKKQGKIEYIKNKNSVPIIDQFKGEGCTRTLNDLIASAEEMLRDHTPGVTVGPEQNISKTAIPVSAPIPVSGGAKKVVKRIAKKIASKRGKGRGRGRGGRCSVSRGRRSVIRGRGRGRGRGRR